MKTIRIALVHSRECTLAQAREMNHYSFNSEDDLQVGDLLKSPDYGLFLKVVDVIDVIAYSEQFQVRELSACGKPRTVAYTVVTV